MEYLQRVWYANREHLLSGRLVPYLLSIAHSLIVETSFPKFVEIFPTFHQSHQFLIFNYINFLPFTDLDLITEFDFLPNSVRYR